MKLQHQWNPQWWEKDKSLSIEGTVTNRVDVPHVHRGYGLPSGFMWDEDRLTTPFQDRASWQSRHFPAGLTGGGSKKDPHAISIARPSIRGFQEIPSQAAETMQTPHRTQITYGPTSVKGSGQAPMVDRMLQHLEEASQGGMIGGKRKQLAFPGG